ncbi:uncharacterized protein AKAW2_51598S [Aspergillus luchuensis]|uniref:Similar to An08g07465 n=1 Tax=Aspergillus kawachii TaxID=1069201 RepID=A0A146FUT5_ASPKA|nr:uncharacterized protein AKAW2_51598S [Aspergillus luchuensis]BCS01257.1 hypothetical protein AKAW2_51598S [Aspergillus luchuensis]GAA83026.1 similar to An08g07465 [Aspergillus luchuensis IFO 4308]GAT28673.1 similar to An08g07465 [Aspergillus luchuensis]
MAYFQEQETDEDASYDPNIEEDENISKLDVLRFEGADTIVFIDPPSYVPNRSLQPQSEASIPHYVHSHTLLDTKSPYFTKLFDPRRQARMIKRSEFLGNLPDGIKYVINLTPPSTDDEAVAFTTELSCPLGIRTWTRELSRLDLPVDCVGGEDEGIETEGGSKKSALPSEYSDSRHRTGIVHILQALGGVNPCLDTPCKLWTFFALAKVFGIATIGHIKIHILTWLYDGTNACFIELHPEITYRIARGIECDYLCQDSFTVLVGEEALLRLANAGKPPRLQWPEVTFHGRQREPLDDEDRQRIEYASQSLVDRILEEFIQLTGSQMDWLLQLPSTMMISRHIDDCAEHCSLASDLLSSLKLYVRGHIVANMTRSVDTRSSRLNHYIDPCNYPEHDYTNSYKNMRYVERIISKTFWRTVRGEGYSDCLRKPDEKFRDMTIADLGGHLHLFQSENEAKLSYVSLEDILRAVNQFNNHVDFDSPKFVQREWGGGDIFIEKRGGSLPDLDSDIETDETPEETATESSMASVFDPIVFLQQVRTSLGDLTERMAKGCRQGAHFKLTDTITCLTNNEFRYLPLWAGGDDDGSGGVFTDQGIPNLETGGFSMPGPAIHTGSTAPSTTSYSNIAPSEGQSTVQCASHKATGSQWADVVSLVSSEGHAIEDESYGPTPDEKREDTEDTFIDMDTSADDFEDYFDTDSEDNDTVIVGTPSQSDPIEETSELLEHMSLEMEAGSK